LSQKPGLPRRLIKSPPRNDEYGEAVTKKSPKGTFLLLLLLVDSVLLGDRVELLGLVLLTWILLYLVVKASVVHVTLTNAISVPLGYELYE
jgi:hypothetical protein